MLHGSREELIVSERCIVDCPAEDVADHGGVRRCSLRNEYVPQLDLLVHAAAGADADEFLHAIVVHQLIGIDGDGRHPHARPLYGDRNTVIGARITEDVADGGIFLRPLKEILCDELCAQRIARQQNALGNLALFGSNMQ